jgi:molybdate transport system substrate-binding protein
MRRPAIQLLLGMILIASGPAVSPAQELTLSVAISMKEAVEELGRGFRQAHSGAVLRYNFASSGELQKQIEAGAPVDMFISAGEAQMDALERKRLILPETRRTFAKNALVVAVPADSPLRLAAPADLLRPHARRIAIGNPKTVPAGQYAEESLRTLGLWDSLRPKLVFAENVRQVLEYVARGEVEAGFVYATDVTARGGRVNEAFRPPQSSYQPVTYPAAVVAGSRNVWLGQAFIELLVGRAGQASLARLGFQPLSGVSR